MSAITWQRPQSPQFSCFCAVTRYEGGASISACGGRWETSSTYVLIGVDVGKLECPACRDALDEVPILDSDLAITVGCEAVHPDRRGGQHVAKSCTGVRIRHVPTGLEVLSTDERSQHGNREASMRRLRSMLSAMARDPVSVALTEPRDAPAIRTAELHTAPREGVLFEAFDTSDAERDA